jgi:hypothetical protein
MESNFEIDGLVKQREELEKLMMSNPAMEKKVQGLIRKVLMEVRKHMGDAAKSAMKSDPRQAYKAVKTAVYRQILGGSVSILNKEKPGVKFSDYEPVRTLRPGQRGGNRMTRSDRTRDLIKYAESDRGFILRFLNSGTQGRAIEFKEDEAREHVHRGSQGGSKYGKTINTGSRGNIAPRNFFGSRSQLEMENAAKNLQHLIDELIKQEMK